LGLARGLVADFAWRGGVAAAVLRPNGQVLYPGKPPRRGCSTRFRVPQPLGRRLGGLDERAVPAGQPDVDGVGDVGGGVVGGGDVSPQPVTQNTLYLGSAPCDPSAWIVSLTWKPWIGCGVTPVKSNV
jgi:hypothetical protein